MAPRQIGPGIGSRRHGTRWLLDPGCRDCLLPGVGRSGDGGLSGFSPKFHSLAIGKQQGDIHDPQQKQGIIDTRSNHSVDQTVERLKGILEAKGVTLFALVDHSGEAARVGMKMRPTKLLIFGSPKAGTPVMLAAPSSAMDLPLKILIREDDHGKVWVSYNSSEYLQERHDIPKELLPNIAAAETLVAKAAE
jgi:uncharacterized protein (DUF302 family)